MCVGIYRICINCTGGTYYAYVCVYTGTGNVIRNSIHWFHMDFIIALELTCTMTCSFHQRNITSIINALKRIHDFIDLIFVCDFSFNEFLGVASWYDDRLYVINL